MHADDVFLIPTGIPRTTQQIQGVSAPTSPETDVILRCTFCQKSRLDVAKLIASPDGRTHICNECALQPSQLALVSEKSQSRPSSRLGIFFDRISCSFCKKKVRPSRAYVSAGCVNSDSYICKNCLSVCRQILSDEARARNPVNSSGKRGAFNGSTQHSGRAQFALKTMAKSLAEVRTARALPLARF
jgi:ClpX C4-type zinc finger protein